MHQELSLYTLKNLYSEIWCVSTAVSFYFFSLFLGHFKHYTLPPRASASFPTEQAEPQCPRFYLSSCSGGTASYEDSRQSVVYPEYPFPWKAKHSGVETVIKFKSFFQSKKNM